MSNTSYPFKENSIVMNVQGGEKKVMKKILTVALSTAMAFSMFASVAFGDTAVTPQQKFDALAAKGIFNGYPDQQAHLEKEMTRAEFAKVITKLLGLKEVTGTLSYKDKGYDAKNWAVPYIEAVTAAGIMQGQDTAKKIFNYNGKVTIQEMATVLVRALKLEVPANPNNSATEWAKGYVQAAIDKGLIPATANFQANASRSQLVEAAYAIDQAKNITFTYKIVDPSNVEFTLSTGEVVKVKLDKPLEANKETEVKFKDAAGNEYTAKVTWAVTTATKVDSASATNLKQVVVTFDGTVDPASAQNINNYNVDGKVIDSVTLSADNKVATILLDKDSALANQKKTFVQVSNVKNEGATKTITQKVEFTPLDVAAPEVQSVTGLGTKAFKVKFSEPVKPEDMISTNFRIDDQPIAATVKYSYPDTAIVVTNLTEGNHTLRVSNVKDFSGLAIAPVAKEFTVTQDTTAPKVVSAKSYDLKQVTVEFDETIKSVSSAYANVSSVKASKITVNDNKVTLEFAQPLSYTENVIHISGVKDYSDNSADVDVNVTPTLDVTRPTVVTAGLTQDTVSGRYVAEIKFSKEVLKGDAEKRENYVLKDSDGNIAKVSGVNKDGNPVRQPVLDKDGKTVTVDLGSDLKDVDYTLTISGIRDTAYVGNVLLPQTVTLSGKVAATGQIDRAWLSRDGWLYIQLNKTLSTSGAGSAADPAKYTVDGKVLTTSAANVEFVSTNTVRIKPDKAGAVVKGDTITVSYIQDADGNYLRQKGTGSYNLTATVKNEDEAIIATEAKITGTKEVKVTFDAPLSEVRLSEIYLKNANGGSNIYPNDFALSSDNKTLTLKFEKDLPATFAGSLVIEGYYTRDAFGNAVVVKGKAVENAVSPAFVQFNSVVRENGTVAKYTINVKVSKEVSVYDTAQNLFTLQIGDVKAKNVTVKPDSKDKDVLVVTGEFPVNVANDSILVTFNGTGNAASKAIVDGNGNAMSGFEEFASAPDKATDVATPEAPTGVKTVNASAADKKDGKLTNVTNQMEYRAVGANDWNSITGTEVTGLAPGKYEVRTIATGNTPASKVATVSVGVDAPAAPANVKSEDAATKGAKGKITGLTDKMEYREASQDNYVKVPTGQTEVSVDPGTYYVRYAEAAPTPASATTKVVVNDGPEQP